ncbi:hypothetical protein [Paraglaciecola sp.]|uniref:hypothetical protein n=1 Tax=Paraglaciecola sp. TaxID=1920173 RepID=UPI00273FF36A|nr:hypothetical protein [Paraglaciecola sp.]MDP5033270.1 hypothetical protein [Paraglaciecola sp.]
MSSFNSTFKKYWTLALFVLGCLLLIVNLYGLTQEIRPSSFSPAELRFKNESTLSFEDSYSKIKRENSETDLEYALRINELVSDSLIHVQWNKINTHTSHQLIPVWENYILFLMGKFSNIPEYERYHFANYKRSLKRGIGVCGDASMVLSQLLDKHGIENKIISFPKHVVVKTDINGAPWILDPDFGVAINSPIYDLKDLKDDVELAYLNKGYSSGDLTSLDDAFKDDFEEWNGVSHFITNKYYFEIVSYWAKWLIPIFLILPFSLMKLKSRQYL